MKGCDFADILPSGEQAQGAYPVFTWESTVLPVPVFTLIVRPNPSR